MKRLAIWLAACGVWAAARVASAFILVEASHAKMYLLLSAIFFAWLAATISRSILLKWPPRTMLLLQLAACAVGWGIGRVVVTAVFFESFEVRALVLALLGLTVPSATPLQQMLVVAWGIFMPLAMVILVDRMTVLAGKQSPDATAAGHA